MQLKRKMSCTHLAPSLPRKSNLCLIFTVQISQSTLLVWEWFTCEWDISQSKENISLIRNRSHQPASKKHLGCATFSGVCSAGWPMTDHVSVSLNASSHHRNNSINTFPSRKDPILGSGWVQHHTTVIQVSTLNADMNVSLNNAQYCPKGSWPQMWALMILSVDDLS